MEQLQNNYGDSGFARMTTVVGMAVVGMTVVGMAVVGKAVVGCGCVDMADPVWLSSNGRTG